MTSLVLLTGLYVTSFVFAHWSTWKHIDKLEEEIELLKEKGEKDE